MIREKQLEEELEDITGQTGWMYTDLFVGLMVIFLATISFIPENARFVDPRAVQTYTEIYPTPLANKYFQYNYKDIRSNIDKFVKKEGFSGFESVARVQIVVSFNPSLTTSGEAIARATEISMRLQKDDPKLFAHTVSQLKATPDITSSYFVLEFTFNRFVQVIKAETP